MAERTCEEVSLSLEQMNEKIACGDSGENYRLIDMRKMMMMIMMLVVVMMLIMMKLTS